jgi:asparagine synthase (glutamine-hydrolysing)
LDGLEEARALFGGRARDLDGMYAIASLAPDGSIEVARDPLGIKPLYVRAAAGAVAVASEPRALVEMLGECRVRAEAVAQFLLFGRVVDGSGWFEGISPVLPGARLRLRGGKVEALDRESVAPASDCPSAGDLREAVAVAIERVLVADRPLGLAISGGLDSSILAHEVARLGVEDVRTVSVVFPGLERLDGLRDLEALELPGSAWRSWSHRWELFRPEELLDEIPDAVRALGAPTSLASVAMYARMVRLAADSGIVALLLGEGADELFGGYRSYLGVTPGRTGTDFYLPSPDLATSVEELLGGNLCEGAWQALQAALPEEADEVEVVRSFELEHSLQPLLERADALLMQRSIEGRTPFLHGNLPSMALALNWSDLVGEGQTKVALRRAYAAPLPRFASERKQPFRAPMGSWSEALGGHLQSRLVSCEGRLAGLGVRPRAVGELLASGFRNEATLNLAFRLVTLAEWISLEGTSSTDRDQILASDV